MGCIFYGRYTQIPYDLHGTPDHWQYATYMTSASMEPLIITAMNYNLCSI